jgi:hypothetical protein
MRLKMGADLRLTQEMLTPEITTGSLCSHRTEARPLSSQHEPKKKAQAQPWRREESTQKSTRRQNLYAKTKGWPSQALRRTKERRSDMETGTGESRSQAGDENESGRWLPGGDQN